MQCAQTEDAYGCVNGGRCNPWWISFRSDGLEKWRDTTPDWEYPRSPPSDVNDVVDI
jgi:hypothetical protein